MKPTPFTYPDYHVLFLHVDFTTFEEGIIPYLLVNPHVNNTGTGIMVM